MKYIPLSKFSKINAGKYFAQVDDEDFEELNRYNWSAWKCGDIMYAIRKVYGIGKPIEIKMHRAILGLSDSKMFCDHIDHNGLNNQRSNLRAATPQENQRNGSSRRGSTSKYLGVCFDRKHNFWKANVNVNGKQTYLGCFKTEEEAARARDAAAMLYHGEFANLNFKNAI